jgi:hypothetical protein
MNDNKEEDKLAIDKLTAAFFSVFTNTNGVQPSWEAIHNTCIPEVVIIKHSGQEHVVYNLNSFIEPRKKILSDGTLTEFSEKEVSEETVIIDHIAQRYSRYEKSGHLNGVHFHEYGNKLFQFIKTDVGWRISSVVWEDE